MTKRRALPAAVRRAARGSPPFSAAPLLDNVALLQAVAARLTAADRATLRNAAGPGLRDALDDPAVWHATVIDSPASLDAARGHAHAIRTILVDDTCDVDDVRDVLDTFPNAVCSLREPFSVVQAAAGDAAELPVRFQHLEVFMHGGVAATPPVVALASRARSATFFFQRDALGASDLTEAYDSDAGELCEVVSPAKLDAFAQALASAGCHDVSFELI